MRAGTGRVDVSPRKSMFLWGYPHVERMSTGVNDPLYATALCLDDGERKTIAVVADVLFVTAQQTAECRRRIEERTGVPAACVMISATHTHSGPVTCTMLAMTGDPVVPEPDPEYIELMVQGITDAACEAVTALEPAELAVASARVDGVGCNRLNPDGPRDPEAGIVIARRKSDGRIVGIQVLYSMHPTVMHEDSKLVSSDFPGYTRLHIEESFPGARVVYHSGPCGNQSPRYHVNAQTFEEAERLGRRLGAFVTEAIGSLRDKDYSDAVTVEGRSDVVALVPRHFASIDEAQVGLTEARANYERLKRENAGHGPVRTAECTVFGAEEVVTMSRAQAEGRLAMVHESHRKAEVQVLRIGDTVLVGLPGELFVEYALEIKQRSGARAFVSSLANGELQGYITTPDAVGYEANLSVFRPESGVALVETALKLITESGQ